MELYDGSALSSSSSSGRSALLQGACDGEACALTTDALLRVLEHLPPNEVACTARLLCKETASQLSAPQHRTVRLIQPIPPHAAAEWQRWEGALRHLTFRGKLGVLSTAAASGCEANIEVAWRLVRPSFFPGLPLRFYSSGDPDRAHELHALAPGIAAARAGHAHLLPWLVEHGCPLDAVSTLEAVAEHCDLAALQQAWALFNLQRRNQQDAVLKAAARSRTPDALSKLQWLTEDMWRVMPRGESMPSAAVEGDNMDRLLWLQRRGCVFADPLVLQAALEHSSMDVVRWVASQYVRCGVEEFAALSDNLERHRAASSGVEAAAKLRWLQEERGANLAVEGHADVCSAARAGRLEAVRYLVEECGVEVGQGEDEDGGLAEAMAEGGDQEVMAYLLQRGVGRSPAAYGSAASRGDLRLVRWLVAQGFPVWHPDTLGHLVDEWRACSTPGSGARAEEDCLAAVQAVVGAGGVLNERAVESALYRGSLPLVRWLVEEKGCLLPPNALTCAASAGCAALLEWLAARGCPSSGKVGAEYVWPAKKGDRATLVLLRQLGVPWDRAALPPNELRQCGSPVLRWLVDHGMLHVAVVSAALQDGTQSEEEEEEEEEALWEEEEEEEEALWEEEEGGEGWDGEEVEGEAWWGRREDAWVEEGMEAVEEEDDEGHAHEGW